MPSQTDQYGPNMQQIMMKILIISEVALLSEEIEDAAKYNVRFIRRAGPAAPGGSLLLSKMQSQLRFDTSPPNDESTNKPPNDSKGQVSNRGDASFAFHIRQRAQRDGSGPMPSRKQVRKNEIIANLIL